MKTKAKDASIEELLQDITCWEDWDSCLMLRAASGDKISKMIIICNFNGEGTVITSSIKDYLLKIGNDVFSYATDEEHEDLLLDWK